MQMKTCARCKEPKPIHFYSKGEWNSKCGFCSACVSKRNKGRHRYAARAPRRLR